MRKQTSNAMKKFILLIVGILLFTLCNGQENLKNDKPQLKSNDTLTEVIRSLELNYTILEHNFNELQSDYIKDMNNINLSGLYLKRASTNSFYGLTCLLLGASLSAVGVAFQSDIAHSKGSSASANTCYLAGGVFSLTAIIFYACVPFKINKAGKTLLKIK